jgi:hypothetical protein
MEMLDERGDQLSHARIARLGVASDDLVGDRLFARRRRRCAFARRRPAFTLSSRRLGVFLRSDRHSSILFWQKPF